MRNWTQRRSRSGVSEEERLRNGKRPDIENDWQFMVWTSWYLGAFRKQYSCSVNLWVHFYQKHYLVRLTKTKEGLNTPFLSNLISSKRLQRRGEWLISVYVSCIATSPSALRCSLRHTADERQCMCKVAASTNSWSGSQNN